MEFTCDTFNKEFSQNIQLLLDWIAPVILEIHH